MGLLNKLIREGWWDKNSSDDRLDVNYDLTDEQIKELSEGKEIVIQKGTKTFKIRISNMDPKDPIKGDDIDIKEVPQVASSSKGEHSTSKESNYSLP